MTNRKSKNHTFIIAEMAWSHDGSIRKAKRIIKAAADAEADAISFHITNMEDYMVRDYDQPSKVISQDGKEIKMYDYLDRLNLRESDWRKLFAYAKSLGLKICAMPNDNHSLELCRELNPDIYVIASASFGEEDFVKKIAREKKPIILRIGGALVQEIEKIIHLIRKYNKRKIVMLHGIQSYPTKIKDTNLSAILVLLRRFKLSVGIADHINAESLMSYIVPAMALSLGATFIEKHLTHNRSLKGLDYIAAFNPDEFKKFVIYIREAEVAFGTFSLDKLSLAERRYRKMVRKRTVAARDIRKEEKIEKSNITFKRANSGLYPDEIRRFFGKKTKCDIRKNQPIIKSKISL